MLFCEIYKNRQNRLKFLAIAQNCPKLLVLKIHSKRPFRFFRQLIFLYVIKICPIWLKTYMSCSLQGQTPCWKNIFEFEPNLTTFYYIQKYEPSTKIKKFSLNGF